jgi:hypothetical protein
MNNFINLNLIFLLLETFIKTVETDIYIKINSNVKNISNLRKNAQDDTRLKKNFKSN